MSPTYSVCREHGYLVGEQTVCPHCGAKTEVYSRITGYYRPVQNWNDGKAQEFRDRKVYDIGRSRLTHKGPLQAPAAEAQAPAAAAEEAAPKKAAKPVTHAMLFTSATCPNCKLAISMLEKAGYAFKKVLAAENPELTAKYGIKQAPTLVVVEGDQVEKYKGVSEIKGMLNSKALPHAG